MVYHIDPEANSLGSIMLKSDLDRVRLHVSVIFKKPGSRGHN